MSAATTDTASQDADRYLKEVAPHLAALPAEERSDLLDDLAQHLREIAAEPGAPLAERLGPPESYAAELLASAGASAGASAPGQHRPRLAARAAARLKVARASRLGREVVRSWPTLLAAWWVVRAYLAVSLLSAVERRGSYPGFPLPRLAGSPVLGLLGVLVAIPFSIRLGQRRLPRTVRWGVVAANVVLGIYALSLVSRAGTPSVSYIQTNGGLQNTDSQGCLTSASGEHITNLYAYGADGRLLDPVLLYDQSGHPIDNLCPDYDAQGRRLVTQYSQDVNGAPVINAFPRRQSIMTPIDPSSPKFGPTTQTDPNVPVKPPAVVIPRLAPTTTTTVAPAG